MAHEARKPRRSNVGRIADQASHDPHARGVFVVGGVTIDPVVAERKIVVVDEQDDLAGRMTDRWLRAAGGFVGGATTTRMRRSPSDSRSRTSSGSSLCSRMTISNVG
jgi:hypothetical protein